MAMRGFAYALEPHLIEEIESTMGNPKMAASKRYRNLTILGLDEYAISDSKLRKKRFPIKAKIGKPFTVMLSDPVNKEIESIQKKRNQIKKLAIRYIVLLGFEKWKRDNPGPVKVEPVIRKASNKVSFGDGDIYCKKDSYSKFPEIGPGVITNCEDDNFKIRPVPNDMNIGEKFQAVIDLIRELDLKITIEKK